MMDNWLNRRFAARFKDEIESSRLRGLYEAWKIERLAEIVKWAAENSPHYRAAVNSRLLNDFLKALSAADTENAAGRALALLPLTSPDEIAADSDAFLAVSHNDVEGIVTVPTSGTSGPNKRIFATAADLEETVAFFEYGMRILVKPGRDRVALAMSPARSGNVADLLGQALGRWDIPFLAMGFVPENETEESRWLEELTAWRPTSLVGVPPQMLAIGRRPNAAALRHSLKTMLLSGDVADDNLVLELEKSFPNCRVYRHYGLTECGLGGAVECENRAWPHLRDDLWVEIIDAAGRPLEDGRPGEIVITPLTRKGMPLLRYRTGDEGRLLPGGGEGAIKLLSGCSVHTTTNLRRSIAPLGPCACGAIFPRLEVFGRFSDRLDLPGGRIIRPSDFEAPLAALPFVRDFALKLYQGEGGGLLVSLTTTPDRPENAAAQALAILNQWLGDKAKIKLATEIADTGRPLKSGGGGKRRLERTDEKPPACFSRFPDRP